MSVRGKEVQAQADPPETRAQQSRPKPYWDPYAAGFLLGLALLAAFVLTGKGLGASGGLTRLVAACTAAVAPGPAAAHPYWGAYAAAGPVLLDGAVFMVLGVLAGGALGAFTAGRARPVVERGPRCSAGARLALAFAGGAVVGFASRLARGCTSGQGLTGGALLAAGRWAFLLAVFAGGFAVAWFARRQWT